MRIGEAASSLGLADHVLRHWEDEGVVVPRRRPNGYREYDEESLTRARVALQCRDLGMSLAQIKLLLDRDSDGREAVIREHLRLLDEQVRRHTRNRAFLAHVIGCRHSLMSRCADCRRFSQEIDSS